MFPYCFRYFRFSSPEIIHGRRRRRKESERTRRERELYRRSSLLLAFLLSLRNSRALEREEKYTVPEIHVFRGSEREGERSGERKGAERRSEISENRVSIVVTWIRLPRTDLLSPPLTPSRELSEPTNGARESRLHVDPHTRPCAPDSITRFSDFRCVIVSGRGKILSQEGIEGRKWTVGKGIGKGERERRFFLISSTSWTFNLRRWRLITRESSE